MEFVESIDVNQNKAKEGDIIKESKGNKDKRDLLTENISKRSPSCGLIVVDNFYNLYSTLRHVI